MKFVANATDKSYNVCYNIIVVKETTNTKQLLFTKGLKGDFMMITIKAKGVNDSRNYREWTNVNDFLSDVAFWFCSGNECAREVGFFDGVIRGTIYSETKKSEFVRSGIIFEITVEE